MAPNRLLDGLMLTSLSDKALIPRIAALWCKEINRNPYSPQEVLNWVKREFGPIFEDYAENHERIGKVLRDAVRHQLRKRARRQRRQHELDPLTSPAGSHTRINCLLSSRLGPARRWTSQFRLHSDNQTWIHGAVYSGLVAGITPTKMRTRRISNPNLLVYRYRWNEPTTRFVPSHIATVGDAFDWLIPSEVRELTTVPGVQVEHDSEAQAVRVTYGDWGVKLIPWRELTQL